MNNRYRFDNTLDAKGKEKHLHTLDGKPLCGTSTVLSILAKPLTWWASGEAVKTLGWTHSMIDGTRKKKPLEERLEAIMPYHQRILNSTPLEYLEWLDVAYKAHSIKLDDSATAGTDMHGELEEYVKSCITFNDGIPSLRFIPNSDHVAVKIFAEWSMDGVKKFLASEAYCYSERLWTGGIVDLIYEDMDGNTILLDFKSAKEAYVSHFLQNAGYDIALCENGILDCEGNLQAVSFEPAAAYGVFPFGAKIPQPEFRPDVEALRETFEHCLAIYKVINDYGRSISNG